MKGNRIRTALKGAERKRGKKKAHYFETVYCPYAESVWEGLRVSKAYSDASRAISPLKY